MSARSELRRATADIHMALHSNIGFSNLMHGRLTIPEYTQLLARLYGFHYALERELCAISVHLAGGIDLAARQKAHLLRADLVAIGRSGSDVDALPLCAALPELLSQGDIMGCLYVIEGAALGGGVMARNLDCLLGPESSAGRQFFLGRPDPDPLPWPVFCRLLESSAVEGHLADITRSARSTFEAIERWLNKDEKDV